MNRLFDALDMVEKKEDVTIDYFKDKFDQVDADIFNILDSVMEE